MGVWSLRGRETHIPSAQTVDIGPPLPATETYVRGRAARWAGLVFVVFAFVLAAKLVMMWR